MSFPNHLFLDNDILNQVKNSSVNLKYQYSFTDSMALDDLGSCHDFKVI
jgi:hypothetical protein